MTTRLTHRDREVLEVLSHRTRLLTEQQIARTWWSDQRHGLRNCRARMKELTSGGYVDSLNVLAREEMPLREPLVTWSPELAEPDFGKLAWALKRRWEQARTVPTRVVHATRRTKQEHNGSVGGRQPRSAEVSHDIHVGTVFLNYRKHASPLAENWIHEDQLREEYGGKMSTSEICDAMIRKPGEAPSLIVEVGGSYRAEKLQAFANTWSHLPYVIW